MSAIRQTTYNINVKTAGLIQMKELITATPAKRFSHYIFAAFAIPAVLLTDYLPLWISKRDIKLKKIQEH